jgi:hypothetical protein
MAAFDSKPEIQEAKLDNFPTTAVAEFFTSKFQGIHKRLSIHFFFSLNLLTKLTKIVQLGHRSKMGHCAQVCSARAGPHFAFGG